MRLRLVVLGLICGIVSLGFLAGCCGVMMGDYPIDRMTQQEQQAKERTRGITALVLLGLSAGAFVGAVVCFVHASQRRAN